MNLLFLLALKKMYDDNQAIARNNARAYKRARERGKQPKDYEHRYSSKEYSESEFFNKIVTEDEILVLFFDALEKKGKEISEVEAEKIRKVIEVKLAAQSERASELYKCIEEMNATGLEVKLTDNPNYYNSITIGKKVLDAGEAAFGNKGEYAKVKQDFSLTYKGIQLAREWFNDSWLDKNPFEVKFNDWKSNHSDLEEKIKAKRKEIARQERKVKYALVGKEDKIRELEKLNIELSSLETTQRDGEALAKKRDHFAEITPEQKTLIRNYYAKVEECKVFGKDIDKDTEQYCEIKDDKYRYSYSGEMYDKEKSKCQRIMDELITNGDISEEVLSVIDTIFSEESIGYEKYYEGKDRYQMSREGKSETYCKLIKWYIESRREKIITKAVERREQAYAALGKEHKKLLELAGLVDEAKLLEESTDKKTKDAKGDEEYGE